MSAEDAVDGGANSENVDFEAVSNSLLATVHTAVELETSIAAIKPGMGNCRTRRKLKRVLEQVLAKEEIESSMNARVRRRVARVLKGLSPGEKEAALVNNTSSGQQTTVANEITAEQTLAPIPAPRVVVPYVVFVGQIGYSVSVEELRYFFVSKEVNGDIRIRLLTDKETGRSRGMAFVELDNAIEMHKCIALHKSIFQGKAINIEKSCGGKDKDKRKERIDGKRQEQQVKLDETINRIVAQYTTAGVIEPEKFGDSFRVKLHRSGPHVLGKALQAYSRLAEEKRKLARLDRLLDRYKQQEVTATVEP